MSHKDINLGDTVDFKFTTRRFSTGAPFTLAGTPAVSAYVGNSTTQITAGITLSVDFDSVTGLNNARVVASSGNGFALADHVELVITAGTVDSVSVVGEVIGSFAIVPTVTVTNNGVKVNDFTAGAITAAAIADGAIDAATFAAGAINAAAIAADAITAAKIADGAIDAATFAAGAIDAAAIAANAIGASELATDAVNEIRDAVFARAFAASAGSLTFDELVKLFAYVLLGKASGLAGTTATYRNLADSADGVVATVDADGNRTAVTRTP